MILSILLIFLLLLILILPIILFRINTIQHQYAHILMRMHGRFNQAQLNPGVTSICQGMASKSKQSSQQHGSSIAIQQHGPASRISSNFSSIAGSPQYMAQWSELEYSRSVANPESEQQPNIGKAQPSVIDYSSYGTSQSAYSICSRQTISMQIEETELKRKCLEDAQSHYRTQLMKIQGMLAHLNQSQLNIGRLSMGFRNQDQMLVAQILCKLGYVQPERVFVSSTKTGSNRFTQLIKQAKFNYYQTHHCHYNQEPSESRLLLSSSDDSELRQEQKQQSHEHNFPVPVLRQCLNRCSMMDIQEEQGHSNPSQQTDAKQEKDVASCFENCLQAESKIYEEPQPNQPNTPNTGMECPSQELIQAQSKSRVRGKPKNPYYGYLYYRMKSKKQKVLSNQKVNEQVLHVVKCRNEHKKEIQSQKAESSQCGYIRGQQKQNKRHLFDTKNLQNNSGQKFQQKQIEICKRKSLSKVIFNDI